MNEDVTVIITCFNYGHYLAESVQSALSQAGGEPLVTVIDDGSTEQRTLVELDRLPIQVELIRQANGGPAAARNAGLRLLRTPYALILDADDRLEVDALQRLRAPLDRDPTLGFSYGLMRFFGAWEGILRMPPYDPYRLLYRHNIGSVALTRRELFEDIGGYDPAFDGYEDWELWVHALARGWRGERVEAVTLHYRRHAHTTTFRRARPHYRSKFRQLRQKHRVLYRRNGRRRLQAESDLGTAGRLAYRLWWGWRPLPARVELALQAAVWRPRRRSNSLRRRATR
ncbi:MAG: glycosyltransferase family 2 protein [Solirubrobacterales bacterium]|nr:glycosyltransferase family 2 protein [Solirubrobacterales bacterium]